MGKIAALTKNMVNNMMMSVNTGSVLQVKKMATFQISENAGFTLIETIAVLMMIGIISAVAIARYSGDDSNLYTVETALKNHIRHAQSRSMFDDDVLWGVKISGNKYWMVQEGSNTVYPAWGADIAEMQASDGKADTSLLNVTINSTDPTVYFNSMGVPFSGDTSNDTNRLGAAINITLRNGSGSTRTITITPETGFVP